MFFVGIDVPLACVVWSSFLRGLTANVVSWSLIRDGRVGIP